jgi:protein-S-isoprenylcysteine O-methyltransferase Ste14
MLQFSIAAVVILGSVVYLYFYQIWPQRHATGQRVRIESDRLFTLFYRFIQISTPVYAGLCLSRYQLPWNFSVAWDGVCLSVASIMLFVWSMLSLRGEYSHCFDSYVATSLVKRGPYAVIRHPIYVANCLMLLGLFIATDSWGVLANAGILAVFYYRAACREEFALARHLPGYAEYLRSTGRFFPRIDRIGRWWRPRRRPSTAAL